MEKIGFISPMVEQRAEKGYTRESANLVTLATVSIKTVRFKTLSLWTAMAPGT